MSDLRTLAERYRSALQEYLAGTEEPALLQAYEIGHQAVGEGLGILDVATVHGEALARIVQQARTPGESAQAVKRATSFLMESVSPFEMIERGFREANTELRRVNETLEQRVLQRTAEQQAANVELEKEIAERKKREAEIVRLNRTLRALSDINQAMMRVQGEAEFLQKVCQIVVEDCGHAMVWIGYAEENEAKTVRPVAHAGFDEGYLETLKVSWADTERGRGPTGTAIRTGKPSACRDMRTDPDFTPWREEALKRGYVSSIVLPLMANDKAFGALTIYSREPDPFSEDEVQLLSELADDLAFGLTANRLRRAHAEAEEALRRSEERYRSLFNAMSEGFALHEIICDEEGKPCDYIFLDINPGFERLTGLKREQVIGRSKNEIMPDDDPLWVERYGKVALTGEPVQFDNYSPALKRHYEVFAYRPVPRQFAVVFMDITDRKRMEEELRKSEERERRRVVELETVLEAVPAAVWIAQDPQCRVITGNRAAAEVLRIPKDANMSKSAPAGERPETFHLFKDGREMRPEDMPVQLAAGGAVIENFEFDLLAEDDNVRHMLGNTAPLRDERGQVRGAVAAFVDITDRKRAEQALRASKDDLERIVAERTAELRSANARLRSLTRAVVSTQEEERRRVSRELHDEAGQVLTVLKLSLQVMQDELPSGWATYRQRLGDAIVLTDKTLDHIRLLAQDLRPAALEMAGLNAALEGLCREFAHRTQININYSGTEPPDLGPAAIGLYRLLQEALTNAARHGHATEIQVQLENDAEQVSLSVADNGQGFDAPTVLSHQANLKGMGLIGMQERINMVGGQLEIHSNPGCGTRLIAHVPLEEA